MVANEASVSLFAKPDARTKLPCCARAAHPIVLVESLSNLPDVVAPDMARLGVMLAYAPVHHLLFHAAAGVRQVYQRDGAQDFAAGRDLAPIPAARRWSPTKCRKRNKSSRRSPT